MLTDLIGISYLKGGRDPHTGLDCWGLCREVYRRLGIEIPEYSSPEESGIINEIIQKEMPSYLKLSGPEAWCLVAFMIHPPLVTHVGVVLEDCRRFIHIFMKRNCCIENLDHYFWIRRIKGYYRWTETSN